VMSALPIIQLTVQGMKHSILHALSEYETTVAEELRRAVEEWCQPENVERVVSRHVHQVLDAAVHDEVERFYRRGEGAEVVREAIRRRLTGRGDDSNE
jgi:hypothetical protein